MVRSLILLLVLGLGLRAEDWEVRMAALSAIESGGNDRAVGRAGEVSRYQVLPRVWRAYAPGKRPEDPRVSGAVVMRIMRDRARIYGPPRSDRDWYVYWNAPARRRNPSPVILERADRFTNYCRRIRNEQR